MKFIDNIKKSWKEAEENDPERKWEVVSKDMVDAFYTTTSRLKIHGGWLIKRDYKGGALCFVPDVNHEWDL